MGPFQTAIQQAVESQREPGSTFGALLVLGPDGVTPMHISPDDLLAALALGLPRQPLLLVNTVVVSS